MRSRPTDWHGKPMLDRHGESEIARRLGCSQVHISRLLRATLERLRERGEGLTRDEAVRSAVRKIDQIRTDNLPVVLRPTRGAETGPRIAATTATD